MKNRFIALGIGFILVVPGYFLMTKKQVDTSRTLEMVQRDMVSSITEKGRVQSVNEYQVVAKSEGRILSIPIKEGDWVEGGNPLVRVDTDLALQKCKEAQSQLTVREVELKQVLDGLKTKKVLLDAGSLSKFDYDESQMDLI